MDATDAHRACFEAGVTFGSLYHQFAGTPVSPASADALAAAIESAMANQPGTASVTVGIRERALRDACADADHGYVEFTGEYFEATVVATCGDRSVTARLALDGADPRMRIDAID